MSACETYLCSGICNRKSELPGTRFMQATQMHLCARYLRWSVAILCMQHLHLFSKLCKTGIATRACKIRDCCCDAIGIILCVACYRHTQ